MSLALTEVTKPPMFNETGIEILKAIQDISAAIYSDSDNVAPHQNASGEYTNLREYFNSHRNGLTYTVKIPKFSSDDGVTCVKADSNVGLTCTPSTNTTPGTDDYVGLGPFQVLTGNGTVDENGMPHVHALSGDTDFALDGSNGDVWQIAPVLWWRYYSDADWYYLSICDTYKVGFTPQPGAKLPDGTLRPFMMYARYPGVMVGNNFMSASGYPVKNSESHNTLIDKCVARGTGYAPSTHADDWYISTMFYMKYAKKSSQEVFGGCTSYNYQPFAKVSETGVKRVILANADAASLIVGSSVCVGSMSGDATKSKDRSNAWVKDVVAIARITSIEDYDSSNKAVNLDAAASFDTVADTTLLSTLAWFTGCCDNVLGLDGSITTPSSMAYPFKIQGIELMHGYFEVLGDVATYIDVTEGDEQICDVYICYDSADGLKTTSNYTNTGVSLGTKEAGGWVYQEDIVNAGGLLVGVGTEGTTSKGTGDGTYSNTKVASTGVFHAYCARGSLTYGAPSGLRSVGTYYGLSYAYWYYAGRPSALGRSAA